MTAMIGFNMISKMRVPSLYICGLLAFVIRLGDVVAQPIIVSTIPSVGQTISSTSYTFLAEVVDSTTAVTSVKFQLQDPNLVQQTFQSATKDPASNVWSLSYSLSMEGQYQWRIRATNSSNTPTTTAFQSFWVSRTPAGYVAQSRSDIADLIVANPQLAPKFVRLGFHDCVGKCDGCVDMTNGDNNGLDIPINALTPIVQKYANQATTLSRADIWALSGLVGADKTQQKNLPKVSFPMTFIGRVNCENAQTICYNSKNQVQPCNATRGPHRDLPSPNLATSDLLRWFSDHFGFNASQTVALMGAHSIGSLSRTNSGFDGPNGWDTQNLVLSNTYYAGLVGGNNGSLDSLQTKLNAPNWNLALVNNSDIPNMPNRYQWQHPLNPNNTSLGNTIMLDADIALVRNVTDYMNASTGEVKCTFLCQNGDCSVPNKGPVPACPYASVTLDFAAQYKNDNLLWLNDFQSVFNAMLNYGYNTSATSKPVTAKPTTSKPVTAKPVTAKPITSKPIAPVPKPVAPVVKPVSTPLAKPAPVAKPVPAKPVPVPTVTASGIKPSPVFRPVKPVKPA